MLGSKSGFDTVSDCFDDLTPHIFALETGLSSDPPMNRRLSMLDEYTLVSSSDAHSPQKLMREATLLETEPTYDALFAALKSGDPTHFKGTLEFSRKRANIISTATVSAISVGSRKLHWRTTPSALSVGDRSPSE